MFGCVERVICLSFRVKIGVWMCGKDENWCLDVIIVCFRVFGRVKKVITGGSM